MSHTSVGIIISVLAFIGNSLQIYVDYIGKVEIPESLSVWYYHFKNYNHVWLGIVLFLLMRSLYGALIIGQHNGMSRLLDVCDKYSYYIYLVHQFIILGPFSLMQITKYIGLNILIITVLTLIMALIVRFLEDTILKSFAKLRGLYCNENDAK